MAVELSRVIGGSPQLITIGADKTLAIWDTISFKVLYFVKGLYMQALTFMFLHILIYLFCSFPFKFSIHLSLCAGVAANKACSKAGLSQCGLMVSSSSSKP